MPCIVMSCHGMESVERQCLLDAEKRDTRSYEQRTSSSPIHSEERHSRVCKEHEYVILGTEKRDAFSHVKRIRLSPRCNEERHSLSCKENESRSSLQRRETLSPRPREGVCHAMPCHATPCNVMSYHDVSSGWETSPPTYREERHSLLCKKNESLSSTRGERHSCKRGENEYDILSIWWIDTPL